MFPVLYGKSSNGKTKLWSICAENGVIITNHGYVDGVIQRTERAVEAKNVGKKNATTLQEQAVKEALSKWTKKKKAGYQEEDNGETTSEQVLAPWAMLALDFGARAHNIVYPCYGQPKLDGTRAIFNGQFYSREWHVKDYPHLVEEARALNFPYPLDGEIFTDQLEFEKLAGLTNKVYLTHEDKHNRARFNYFVFDCVAPDLDFCDRLALLQKYFSHHRSVSVFLVQTTVIEKEQDVLVLMKQYVQQGFEGAMVRNARGSYKSGYRSSDLQKCKPFHDDEFEIIGYKEGKGKYAGCVIWQCITVDGKSFWVNPSGTDKENAERFARADEYIGSLLTVKYQEKTKYGVPRFPVGKNIKNLN